MVLASDLRCLWLAKYDVEFTMTSLTGQLCAGSLPTKDLRRLLRQPPLPTVTGDKAVLLRKTLGQQSEKQCQSTTGDSSILKPKSKLTFKHLTPPNLFM
ncbi:unnamed protein product [Heterobilharzia americana]|nr:unnamed protein product [Heterobilharzia americana]